jgi:hypothetical protein
MTHYILRFWSSAHGAPMPCDLSLPSAPGSDGLLEGFDKAGRYALLLHALDQFTAERRDERSLNITAVHPQ